MSEKQDKTITQYANGLLFLLVAVVSVIILLIGIALDPEHKTWSSICINVGTSFLASGLFAFLYTQVAERHNLRVISNALSENVAKAISDLKIAHVESLRKVTQQTLTKIEQIERSYYHEIASHFREYVPADYFPPTNEPDLRFNFALQDSMMKSQLYVFKGVTGRHIPSRIIAMKSNNLTCKVLILDPSRDDLLWMYARDRFGSDESQESLTQKVKREIYMTVVALFEVRTLGSLEIKIHDGPIFFRSEIFDEEAFVSYFTGTEPTAYPVTYVYEKDTFYYKAFYKDYLQTLELPSPSITFNVNSTDDDLFTFLKRIGYEYDELTTLKEDADNFWQQFSRYLE
jgi:hypothetical protein